MSVTAKSPTNGRPATAGVAFASPVANAMGTTAVPPVSFDHEDLVVRKGRRSGRYVVVATPMSIGRIEETSRV